MRGLLQTFEVLVEVPIKGSRHFSYRVGHHIESTTHHKMFHFDVRTPDQAIRRAEKHGRPVSCRKVNVDKIEFNVDNLFEQIRYGATNPYPNAIAMDEMIWKKKGKRQDRINNKEKDGNGD